jgi:transcriptional regulator with XRE-family HTH domain
MGILRRTLAKNMRSARKNRGLTQAEMAEKAEISYRAYQDIELESVWATDANIERIARVHDIDPLGLFSATNSQAHMAVLEIMGKLDEEQTEAVLGVLQTFVRINSTAQKKVGGNSNGD